MNKDALKQLLKRFPCKELDTGNIRTCIVQLSHPYTHKKAKPMEQGKEGKFMATLLFPEGADVSMLEEYLDVAATEKFGSKWLEKGVKTPWRDGAEPQYKDKPGYGPGVRWFRASSDKRPDVINRHGERIEDADEIYGGCWALVTLRAYAVEHGNVRRVVFGLQNVMKLLDDDRLGGGAVSAAREFEPVEDLDDIDALMAGDSKSEEDQLAGLMG